MSDETEAPLSHDERLEQVLAEYLRRLEQGAAVDQQSFLVGHPDLADDLREFFLNYDRLKRLKEPISESLPPLERSTFLHTKAAQVGLCIGPYTLVQKLGEGGMGEVWVAKQSTPVKRKVALKLIRHGSHTKEVLTRFEYERQALAMMDHPNIAKVFDGGATPDGQPYFVMELVNGLTLTQYCDEGRLTPDQRLQLFVQICQAVQHAHQKGIVHRDLKPSNILVTIYDGQPVPKVIDFGVAKATGGNLTNESLSTQFGAVVGTLEYMSPEQTGFHSQDVDTRADVYSLGVILYELLTGLRPMDGLRLRKAALAEMIRVIQEDEPSKPSTRLSSDIALPSLAALRQIEPKRLTALLRGELDWVVMKCLEKDRNRRYDTAKDLAADVQRYLNDEKVHACPPSVWYRTHKFVRRNKAALAFAGLVLLVLLTLTGGIGWNVRDRSARQADVSRQAHDSLNAARRLLGENKLADARQKLAAARVLIGNEGAALHTLAEEIESLEGEIARVEELFGRVQGFFALIDQAHEAEISSGHQSFPRESEGRVSRHEGDPADAAPLLLAALAKWGVMDRDDWTAGLQSGLVEPEIAIRIRKATYEGLLWLADDSIRRRAGRLPGSRITGETSLWQALAYLRKAQSAHGPTLAFYRIRLRCWKALMNDEAARIDEELVRTTPPTIALDHYLMGQQAYYSHDKAASILEFEAALRLDPSHYWSFVALGNCLFDLERYTEAVRVFTGCLMCRPDNAHGYFFRGNAYLNLDRNEDALKDYNRSIELNATWAYVWHNRAVAYRELGQPDKALADCCKAIEVSPLDALIWHNRATTYRALGQLDKVIADYTRAIELRSNYSPYWHDRATAHRELGQLDKALADYSKAIELDPKWEAGWNDRGMLYRKLGQPAKALADCGKAIELNPNKAAYWSNRGLVYLNLDQPEKANDDFSKAIELDSNYATPWLGRGDAWRALHQPDKAIAPYSEAIRLDPKISAAWHNRGMAYFELGQLDRTVADCSRAIELSPQEALTWNLRGAAYLDLGQIDKADADFSQSIELDPKNESAWSNRGTARSNPRQAGEALADYSRAIALNPKYIHALNGRASVRGALGQWEQAAADYSRMVELDPQNADAQHKFVHCCLLLGRIKEALDGSNLLVDRFPKMATGHHDLAWILANCPDPKFRDPPRAVELAKRAVELAPENGLMWSLLGVAHYRAGAWQEAATALAKAKELRAGGTAHDWFVLAMAQMQLDQKAEACQSFDQAVGLMDKFQTGPKPNPLEWEGMKLLRAEAAELLEINQQ